MESALLVSNALGCKRTVSVAIHSPDVTFNLAFSLNFVRS